MVERPEARLVPTVSESSESDDWEGSGRRSSAEGGDARRRLREPGCDQAESHGYGAEVESGRRRRRRGGWRRWHAGEDAMAAAAMDGGG